MSLTSVFLIRYSRFLSCHLPSFSSSSHRIAITTPGLWQGRALRVEWRAPEIRPNARETAPRASRRRGSRRRIVIIVVIVVVLLCCRGWRRRRQLRCQLQLKGRNTWFCTPLIFVCLDLSVHFVSLPNGTNKFDSTKMNYNFVHPAQRQRSWIETPAA